MKQGYVKHQRLRVRATTFLAGALAAWGALAQDRAEIDRTQIIGSRELPKALYIVPWKKADPGDLSSRPLQSVLDEAVEHVDRDVFRRQVRYHGLIEARGALRDGPAPEAPAAERK